MSKSVSSSKVVRIFAFIAVLSLVLAFVPGPAPVLADPLKEANMVPPQPLASEARVLTRDWIELVLPENEYNADNVTNIACYTITSPDDADYAGGISPALVHHRYFPENAWYTPSLTQDEPEEGKGYNIAHINVVYRIYLKVPVPLEEGRNYTVTIDPSVVVAGPLACVFDPAAPNDVIHANQVAYMSDGPKIAFLSWWTGQGCIDFGAMQEFSLVDTSSGEEVFSGEVELKATAAEEDWAKSDLYSMDFTSFTTGGNYRLYVPGVGSSFPFEVTQRAFNDIGYTVIRGLTMQRDGDHGLDDPSVTNWIRSPAHLDDAYDEATIPGDPKDYYEPSELAQGTRVDLVGGHMDAGDRGRYPHNTADVSSSLLSTITLFPDQTEALGETLQIRESGNGIPDLVDEAVYELDWLRKAVMNTSREGGLPFTLRPNGCGYEGYVPDQGAADRVFYNKSYGPRKTETLFASGALAMAYNTPLLQQYLSPAKLEGYRQAAQKAFDCYENHKDDAGFWTTSTWGDYYDPLMPEQTDETRHYDELMFASANLHQITGEQKYLDYVNATKTAEYRDWRVWYWTHYGPPLYAYLSVFRDTRVDQELRDWARDGIMNGAETTIVYDTKTYDTPYGAPAPWHAYTMVGWYFTGNEMGFPQMLGYGVSGETQYRDRLAQNWNYLLGTNPVSRSFISGLGDPEHRPRWFVHELAQRKWAEYRNGLGGWSEPPPGIPSADLQNGGYDWFMDDAWNAPRKTKRFPALEEYPPLYRYHDGWTTTNEFTIDRMSRNACSLVPLISTEPLPEAPIINNVSVPGAYPGSTVTITGDFGVDAGTVSFGVLQCQAGDVSWGASSIQAKVPLDAYGQADITVHNAQGNSNVASFFVYPYIQSLSPTWGNANSTIVTVTGRGFCPTRSTYPNMAVWFGGSKAVSYTYWSNTQLKVKVGAGANGQSHVKVMVHGRWSNARAFDVRPIITSISPPAGPAGTTLTISGSAFCNLRGPGMVVFTKPDGTNVYPSSYLSWKQTQVKIKVPAGLANTVRVRVYTLGGLSNHAFFTVKP